ncbi:uncharacterized protein LOC133923088 [Phragmites australis]|uniref:uncharacterized protein LOC133923088 n=1 Tax=Phragmites australis TaxID=29695 RepID=UPI002D79D33D|nr:uncharacterized protein LOC133923088 [Phragmites australis]
MATLAISRAAQVLASLKVLSQICARELSIDGSDRSRDSELASFPAESLDLPPLEDLVRHQWNRRQDLLDLNLDTRQPSANELCKDLDLLEQGNANCSAPLSRDRVDGHRVQRLQHSTPANIADMHHIAFSGQSSAHRAPSLKLSSSAVEDAQLPARNLHQCHGKDVWLQPDSSLTATTVH